MATAIIIFQVAKGNNYGALFGRMDKERQLTIRIFFRIKHRHMVNGLMEWRTCTMLILNCTAHGLVLTDTRHVHPHRAPAQIRLATQRMYPQHRQHTPSLSSNTSSTTSLSSSFHLIFIKRVTSQTANRSCRVSKGEHGNVHQWRRAYSNRLIRAAPPGFALRATRFTILLLVGCCVWFGKPRQDTYYRTDP